MNLLFIVLATLATGAVCLYLPSPPWMILSAFTIWLLLATDFVLHQTTGKTLYDHLQNK